MSCNKFLSKQNWYYTISGVNFWAEVLKWLDNQGVKIEHHSDEDIMFGILRCADELFVNHSLIIAKQYLYSCRQKKSLPSVKAFNSKIKMIHTT